MATTDGTEPRRATVVVWRWSLEGRSYLTLHRREVPGGPDGAWTVPVGTCDPDERVHGEATRALWEQTGLVLALTPVDVVDHTPVFAARADADAVVTLDDDHDEHAWLPVREALARCPEDGAADAIRVVDHLLNEG